MGDWVFCRMGWLGGHIHYPLVLRESSWQTFEDIAVLGMGPKNIGMMIVPKN